MDDRLSSSLAGAQAVSVVDVRLLRRARPADTAPRDLRSPSSSRSRDTISVRPFAESLLDKTTRGAASSSRWNRSAIPRSRRSRNGSGGSAIASRSSSPGLPPTRTKTADLRAAVCHLTPQDEGSRARRCRHRGGSQLDKEPRRAGGGKLRLGLTWVVVGDAPLDLPAGVGRPDFRRSPVAVPQMRRGALDGAVARDLRGARHRATWRGALSDDLQLTAIAQHAGRRIVARDVLPRTTRTEDLRPSPPRRGAGTCWCASMCR